MACLRGASEVQDSVLNKVKDSDLRVYTVWVPIRFSDAGFVVTRATKKVSDERVSHYWDKEGVLVKDYSRVLRIDGPAWDVYLLYNRDAEWKQEPPIPISWMNQLGLETAEELDGNKLAAEIRNLLQSKN